MWCFQDMCRERTTPKAILRELYYQVIRIPSARFCGRYYLVIIETQDFAGKLGAWRDQGRDIAFLIGGAGGLSPEHRKNADLVLSFGAATWPHMLARVMLVEQIYRAQEILAGHPYHRE